MYRRHILPAPYQLHEISAVVITATELHPSRPDARPKF